MVMPIALSQPSGSSFMRAEKSWLTSEIVASKRQGPGRSGPLLSTFAVLPPPTPGAGFGMEALEAYVLPSSRLANEAAGTTIRFIQASASPPLPHGHELRPEVYQPKRRPN